MARGGAEGCRSQFAADFGLSVSPIPESDHPPVQPQEYYFALADAQGEEWSEHRFRFDRDGNKWWASQKALEMLRRYLLKNRMQA